MCVCVCVCVCVLGVGWGLWGGLLGEGSGNYAFLSNAAFFQDVCGSHQMGSFKPYDKNVTHESKLSSLQLVFSGFFFFFWVSFLIESQV